MGQLTGVPFMAFRACGLALARRLPRMEKRARSRTQPTGRAPRRASTRRRAPARGPFRAPRRNFAIVCRMRSPVRSVVVALPLLTSACITEFGQGVGASATVGGSHGDGDDDAGGVTDGGWDGGWDAGDDPIEMTGADNDPEAGCPCAQGTELIYLLSDFGALWSFDPETGDFGYLAEVACGGMVDTYSMGVSRKARAWIQYMNGDLYTVDLNDPGDPIACKDPGYQPGDPLFANFGMAFVANGPDDPCDKLYAHSGIDAWLQGPGVGALGVIDPVTIKLATIGAIDYAWGELTGTSDGRLFAFQGREPALLTEYDKETAEVLDVWPLPGLHSDSAFAFAWWGGDFYLFTDQEPSNGASEVWRYDFDGSEDGEALELLIPQAPLRIVGAGVSTCAPPGPM